MLKRKLIDLCDKRTTALTAAETALQAGNQAEYTAQMETVNNLNAEIQNIKNLMAEQERKILENEPTGAEAHDQAEERAKLLQSGQAVTFSAVEVRRALLNMAHGSRIQVQNDTTLATGTIVEPTGTGSTLRGPIGSQPSSIVDQVFVQDLTGMGAFLEPYVITELDAKGGSVKTNAGKARTPSTDPTMGVARISPYEMNVTAYVDRNLSRLSPVAYLQRIQGMAMTAFRRQLANLISNGDGQDSPDFHGIKTAKNVAGDVIYATEHVTGVTADLLDDLFFAYGSDEAIGQNAQLYLTKEDLKAICKLKDNDGRKLYTNRPNTGNPNVGTLEGNGLIVPYCILPSLTSLSTATAGDAPVQTMLYGDPLNFEVGLFGDYTIRLDDSIKGVERMTTILGDAMVGGNLIVDKGFVVATVKASSKAAG